MISLTKISQIQNLDNVYNLVNPHTRLLLYVLFLCYQVAPSGNNLTTTLRGLIFANGQA